MKTPDFNKVKKFFTTLRRKKLLFWVVAAFLAVVYAGFFLAFDDGFAIISSRFFHKPIPAIPGIILFESKTCDHCQNVDTYIKNNKVEEKITFTRLEIDEGDNINILADKAQACGLSPSQLGIPFVWDGQRCILGDIDVISFFKQQMAKKP